MDFWLYMQKYNKYTNILSWPNCQIPTPKFLTQNLKLKSWQGNVNGVLDWYQISTWWTGSPSIKRGKRFKGIIWDDSKYKQKNKQIITPTWDFQVHPSEETSPRLGTKEWSNLQMRATWSLRDAQLAWSRTGSWDWRAVRNTNRFAAIKPSCDWIVSGTSPQPPNLWVWET